MIYCVLDGVVAEKFTDDAGVEHVNTQDVGPVADGLTAKLRPVTFRVAMASGLKPKDEPRTNPREANQETGKKRITHHSDR